MKLNFLLFIIKLPPSRLLKCICVASVSMMVFIMVSMIYILQITKNCNQTESVLLFLNSNIVLNTFYSDLLVYILLYFSDRTRHHQLNKFQFDPLSLKNGLSLFCHYDPNPNQINIC